MIGDFYEASPLKDNWKFQNVKDNVNALAPIFGKHMSNVMN
jgi:hypothetical protein